MQKSLLLGIPERNNKEADAITVRLPLSSKQGMNKILVLNFHIPSKQESEPRGKKITAEVRDISCRKRKYSGSSKPTGRDLICTVMLKRIAHQQKEMTTSPLLTALSSVAAFICRSG
jgi:hypothetical protein